MVASFFSTFVQKYRNIVTSVLLIFFKFFSFFLEFFIIILINLFEISLDKISCQALPLFWGSVGRRGYVSHDLQYWGPLFVHF